MTDLDIMLYLALAARLHTSDAKVRGVAFRVLKRAPMLKRGAIALVIGAKNPRKIVEHMLENWDD